MFGQSHAKKDPVNDNIPMFTAEELIPADQNNAAYQAQMLYQLGANIINSGNAYSAKSLQERNAMSETLKRAYHALPKHIARNGRHQANNPLHPLFVLKIALDHSEPHDVALLYHRLKYAYAMKTINITRLDFPGKSSMLAEQAMLDVLQGYILSHLQKFIFLTHADIAAIKDKFMPHADYFFIIGENLKNNDISLKVDMMLNDHSYTSTDLTDHGSHVLSLMRTK